MSDLERPPHGTEALASWFAEGVQAEISALERDGGQQRYEVQSGSLVQQSATGKALYEFLLADGTRIPDDSSGKLQAGGCEYLATVVGQHGSLIQIELESSGDLPPGIPYAILIVDDTALLRSLLEALKRVAEGNGPDNSLATQVFDPNTATVGQAPLPTTSDLLKLTGEVRTFLERACGSSITYLWGPPGTGKTFAIAHLAAALVEAGERVLVASHTNAAVDQAIYATVSAEQESRGPLSGHTCVENNQVLRVGSSSDPRVPPSVRLEDALRSKAAEADRQVHELKREASPLQDRRAACRAELADWRALAELGNRLLMAQQLCRRHEDEIKACDDRGGRLVELCATRKRELELARKAWFFRQSKVIAATRRLEEANNELASCTVAREQALAQIESARSAWAELEMALADKRSVCAKLRAEAALDSELATLQASLQGLEQGIADLQRQLVNLETELISGARAVFSTLTRSSVGKQLEGQRFEAVIVDELSMALPPLVFLTALKATARVILVGDYLQLPPIVRSDSEVSEVRLRTDAFRLSGLVRDERWVDESRVLSRLLVQRRMLPAIADAARHIAYGPDGIHDHASVLGRRPPDFLGFLPANPLVVVDTSELHCWCGKQPGSLSRFNFYSATAAIEIAALAASGIPQPARGEPPPIGIVTPYAAQRRLLTRLIDQLELTKWVMAGTVHSFQGSQADLIIFDSVLDEPYYTARLCAPRSYAEVRRDINVAVTRAKNKFVLLGSREWLNSHAPKASGMGQLWSFLKERAAFASARDILGEGSAVAIDRRSSHEGSWRMPVDDEISTHEILDERSFYPRLASDLNSATDSLFALAPFFGEYRWPRVQPLIAAALWRGVEVTLVTPPSREAQNKAYVARAVKNLRAMGAVVIAASGLHGKDIVIDERIHYTGSLNWTSHRGRSEIMHRTVSPKLAKLVFEFLQAKYIRQAATNEEGLPRRCPGCGKPLQVINQRRQRWAWDHQPLKIGCADPDCQEYLRPIDERPPFIEPPRCQVDSVTEYRRVRRGRGEVWQCPKHPKECPTHKVVPGDPE